MRFSDEANALRALRQFAYAGYETIGPYEEGRGWALEYKRKNDRSFESARESKSWSAKKSKRKKDALFFGEKA